MPPIGSSVQDIPVTETTPSYGSVARVARILQKSIPSPDAGEGEPNLQDWIDTLIAAEDSIDQALGTSWRARQRKLEYHPRKTWITKENYYRVRLEHGPIRTLDAVQGDALEVWTGSWEDWLATRTEGRGRDYYLEETGPFLYLRRTYFDLDYANDPALRLTYRYGFSAVPSAVKEAASKLAACSLVTGDQVGTQGNGGSVDRIRVPDKKADWWREAWTALAPYQRVG